MSVRCDSLVPRSHGLADTASISGAADLNVCTKTLTKGSTFLMRVPCCDLSSLVTYRICATTNSFSMFSLLDISLLLHMTISPTR